MLLLIMVCKSQPKCIKQNPKELTLLSSLLVLSGGLCIDPAASTEEVTFSFCIYWMENTCSLLPPQPFHDNGQKTGVRWEWRSCPICWVRQEINLHQRLSAVVQNAKSRAWDEMETSKFSFAACGSLLPVWGFDGAALGLLLQNGIDCGCFPGMNSSDCSVTKAQLGSLPWDTSPVSFPLQRIRGTWLPESPYREGCFHPTM